MTRNTEETYRFAMKELESTPRLEELQRIDVILESIGIVLVMKA